MPQLLNKRFWQGYYYHNKGLIIYALGSVFIFLMVIVLIQITYQLTYYFYQGVSLVEPKLASNHGFNYSRNNYFWNSGRFLADYLLIKKSPPKSLTVNPQDYLVKILPTFGVEYSSSYDFLADDSLFPQLMNVYYLISRKIFWFAFITTIILVSFLLLVVIAIINSWKTLITNQPYYFYAYWLICCLNMVGFFLTPLLWFYQKQLLIPWKGKKILASKLPKVQLTNSNILFQVQNLTFAYQNPQLTFLNKSYQGPLVLNNINLTINLGSFTAILGNNGSGKSTLVSCLLNLEPNFQGSVNYAGHNLKRLSPKFLAQNISYFPQTMQLPAAINVYDFVAFGRSPYQRLGLKLTSYDHSIIQQALTATDTFQFADCNLDQLSGGEKQKVFIATILAQQTNVIVLDEPNTYLDVYNQIWLMESLKKLNQLGKTIILVTHDINQAIAYASDLVVLQQGTIYQAGPTKQVVEKKLFQDVFGIDPKLVKVNNLPLITQVKLYEKPTNQINKLY